jgi:hypothetical protein
MKIHITPIFACEQGTEDGRAAGARRSGFMVRVSGFSIIRTRGVLLIVIALASQVFIGAAAMQEPKWKTPTMESVKSKAMDWLGEKKIDETVRAKAEKIWAQTSEQSKEEELLASLAATFALVDVNSERLVALCAQPRGSLVLPDQKWLGDQQTPRFVANNMRLFYARWLVQELLFEEAREQIAGLEPSDVVAPATLLFYQSVVYHKLLEKESGLKTLEELLSADDASPRRYVAVARLMQDDLKELEDDSLDHISRRMDDVRRRLDLGRAGPKVRKVEDGVIESLDKLIKKIEDQRQQQQQSSAGGNTLRPSNPAQESVPMDGKGPGDVTKRDIGSESNWGDLPPKEREEALQQIGRDFPSHYRDVIEQYFKKLASEGSE